MRSNTLLVLMTLLLSPAAAAQSESATMVFRIGAFDRSSQEFPRGTPKRPVIFVAGKSRTRDWYGTQETTSAARSIRFSIAAPAASYHFRVALLIEGSSVPALGVEINGRRGLFYPQPALDHTMGDQVNGSNPAYSYAEVAFSFPGEYLKPGSNAISLQAIEESERPIPDIVGLTYDALELDSSTREIDPHASSAEIVPTIFYQQRAGVLNELVDVFVRHSEPAGEGGTVTLQLNGRRYRQPLRGDRDFGEQKIEFAVPEFRAHSAAQVVWSVAGRSHQREQSIDPEKKWTLFLVPHIHLDVGYSDYQAKVAAVHSRVVDEAMDLTQQHPDFRFSLDGEWSLDQFLKTHSADEQKRAIAAIRNRTLLVPAQYAIMLTGFPTAETLIRSLYPSASLRRNYGTPFDYANSTDVPSYSWSYASVLASAGIRYFAAGSHNDRAPVLMQGHLDEESPFWWEGPDGKRVLTWYSHCYLHLQVLFGLPPQMAAAHDMLPLFLQRFRRPTYRANAAILFGTQVENTDLFPQQAVFAPQWNSKYAYPRIECSGFSDALKNIAGQFGNDIPVVSGDGGPYWEEGIAADAYYAAMERENERRGPSAEKLATFSSLVNPRLAPDKTALARMWTNMVLMGEHTWTSFNSGMNPGSDLSVQQQHVKEQYALNARDLRESVTRLSMANIADSIAAGRDSFIVFNTLNWARSGAVSLDIESHDEIVDTVTGNAVPLEVVSRDKSNLERVNFVARDVPALGYKVFVMQPAAALSRLPEKIETSVLENAYYRVELDPASGAVRGIYDKQLQRQLVNRQSEYRFGQYLYVTGADERPNSILQYRVVSPQPKLAIHGSQEGRLVSVIRTSDGIAARMESSDVNTPLITSEVRLFNDEKKIEFVEELDKKLVYTKEAVYFAFPFALDQAQFQYEIQNGIVDPSKNIYPGGGHDWFSVQHWAAAQQNGVAGAVFPLDSGLVTLGDISRGAWPAEFGSRPGTIFSFVMNNYWGTNWPAGQGGHFRFRYVVTSAPAIDGAALSRMGWQETTPLEGGFNVSGVVAIRRNSFNQPEQSQPLTAPRPLDGKQGSFFDVQDREVVLEALKCAEDGNGTILRFLDLGGKTRNVAVKTSLLHLTQAYETDAVEFGGKPLRLVGTSGFEFTIHPHEIVTVRIIGSLALKSPVI